MEEKKMKRAEKKLENAKAAYQEELRPIFEAAAAALAISDYQRLAAAYQEELAEEARFLPPNPAALNPPKQKKIREKFPQAKGKKSPNNFSMNFISGQADSALLAFRRAAGRFPNQEECAQIQALIEQFSIKALERNRIWDHYIFWKEIASSSYGAPIGSHWRGFLYRD